MFTPKEVKFLLEAVLASPINTNMQGLLNGIKPSPLVIDLIAKLKAQIGQFEPEADKEVDDIKA